MRGGDGTDCVRSRHFLLLTLLCFLLAACGNGAAEKGSEETQAASSEPEITGETTKKATEEAEKTKETAETTGEPSAGKPEETGRSAMEGPEVPPVTPVKNLGELLFDRDSVRELMLVIDQRSYDDITVMTDEEERERILDELYAADLGEWKDIGQEKVGGIVERYRLRSGETEISLSVFQDATGTEQYLKISDSDRHPLAEIRGTAGTFDFGRLSELSTEVRTNTEDPKYSGRVSVLKTGFEEEMNKRACGYALYFFETALKTGEPEAPDETASFDVRIEIGETVYHLQSDTGYFSKEDGNGTSYGRLNEDGLFMVINEAHIGSQLNNP